MKIPRAIPLSVMLANLLFLLCFGIQGQETAGPSCYATYFQYRLFHPNQRILEEWAPRSVMQIKQLSKGVFRVGLGENRYGVIRIDFDDGFGAITSNSQDVTFERFAINLANSLGIEMPTPVPVVLPKRLREMLVYVESKLPGTNMALVRALEHNTMRGVSLLGYYELERGVDFLDRQFGIEARKLMVAYVRIIGSKRLGAYQWEKHDQIVKAWRKLKSDAQQTIVDDLHRLFPTMPTQSVTIETILDHFHQLDGKKRFQAIGRLPTLIWYRLHPEVRQRLAGFWAVFSLLGIPDFHSSNWLIQSNTVIAIDLAYRSLSFTRGDKSVELSSMQHLFTDETMDKEMFLLLQRNISPTLRAAFQNISASKLLALGRMVGIPLDHAMISGIIGRTTFLLQAIPEQIQ